MRENTLLIVSTRCGRCWTRKGRRVLPRRTPLSSGKSLPPISGTESLAIGLIQAFRFALYTIDLAGRFLSIARFIDYRIRCSKPADSAFRRVMVRAWNANVGAIAGWPGQRLPFLNQRITAHQFRHAAGAVILQEQPGNYELVRQILGHRSLSSTIRCYIWLKNIQAHQIYQKLVRKRLKIDLEGDND
jgi:integrase